MNIGPGLKSSLLQQEVLSRKNRCLLVVANVETKRVCWRAIQFQEDSMYTILHNDRKITLFYAQILQKKLPSLIWFRVLILLVLGSNNYET